ncbi:MAG TPA: TIM44-like domain-containing protein [Candidatus Paceibacterota bacterium]|nr:TIM44-like domain-containing protein [Candidatus Pacearchaeota archaeon]HRZ50890.1 TIM44-like domain-containing protein [Candidatus Paceibacterota bacterium]HSA36611.1 TIM44-like domain-containing protein [Candidatus Paceibacterota bacterium]
MASDLKTKIFYGLCVFSFFLGTTSAAFFEEKYEFGNGKVNFFWIAVVIGFWLLALFFFRNIRKKERERAYKTIREARAVDSAWEEEKMARRIAEVFFKFEEAWGHFDIYALKSCATENYYQLLVMEMGVLKRRQRQNFALIPQIRDINILLARDESDNEKDLVVAEILARMDNVLIDTENSEMLLANYDYFRQFWVFRRENDIWKVDAVRSDLERSPVIESSLKGFAQRNGFYYDPDFSQVVIPDKGALFSKTKFGKSQTDNHIIGNLGGRIVEFFTYESAPGKKRRVTPGSDEKIRMLEELENPYGNSGNAAIPAISCGSGYAVAQAILPTRYYDILIRRRGSFIDLAPRGLKRYKGRECRFGDYISLFADSRDDINDFPLATDEFLEQIKGFPTGLNIEVVGSFLYVYSRNQSKVTYEKMLDILKLALDKICSRAA